MRKFRVSNYFSRFLILFAVAGLTACPGGGDGSVKSPDLPPGELVKLVVTCAQQIVSVGQTTSCTAEGTFHHTVEGDDPSNPDRVEGNGEFSIIQSKSDVTAQASWTSSAPDVATVNGRAQDNQGKAIALVTAVSEGQTNIRASLDGKSDSKTITVPEATLQSITVSCNPDTIIVGNTSQCIASGVFNDNNQPPFTRDITDEVDWSSDPTTVATVDDEGEVTGVSAGTAEITATSGSIEGSDNVTVRTLNVTSLDVTPDDATIPPFCTQQFAAEATFEDGSKVDVTSSANIVWVSSVPATTVDDEGLAIAGPQGTATAMITATYTDTASNVVMDTSNLSVENTGVVSLCVEAQENALNSPDCNVDPDFNKPVGVDVPFLAKLVYDNGVSFCPLQPGDPRVVWSSTSEATATINQNGVAHTEAQGLTDIVATMAVVPVSGSHPLSVGDDVLIDYNVIPDFSCVGFYDAVAGLEESPDLPGSQQMLAEGEFQFAGATCDDLSDYRNCTGALNSSTEWSAFEGFWDGAACTSIIPAGSIPAESAPGAVNDDGVVRPSGAIRLGTTCVQGIYTGDQAPAGQQFLDGGTVLVLPVTNDVLVSDAVELCAALEPLLQVGGANGGAGFPVQVVSAISQILNPALTALFNDGAIPIDDILDTALQGASDELTSQLVGPGAPLEVLVMGLDDAYGEVNCAVGGLLDMLLGDGNAGSACPLD